MLLPLSIRCGVRGCPKMEDTLADRDEGVAADGTIRTGARRDRVPAGFEDVLK